MVAIASRARTAVAIAAAGTAVAAGLFLKQRGPSCPLPSETSDILTAQLTSTKVIAGDQDIAVTIRMPKAAELQRPPLSLVVVLDRSGSMHGEPLDNAKRAATALVDRLTSDDAFALVTFSDSDQLILNMDRATAAHKREAADAIDKIYDDGGTCTSCGINRGAAELERSPIRGGVQRMVLISDGQANEGVWDRDELVGLAQATAARGMSITTVGVGLDFDEQTMIRLGEVGRGKYYFVQDTANLGAMFASELSDLGATVATDVHLVIEPHAAEIAWAYGYPVKNLGTKIEIPIADLRAGETRKVVLHGRVAGPDVARFELTWRSPIDRTPHATATTLATLLTRDPAVVAANRIADATAAVEEARTARVLEDATRTYEQYGAEPAKRMIERQLARVRTSLPAAKLERIERAANDAVESF
ncbi:MAG TPA: VWA domain-containing protein, partial [Kofleriaceae bacterium]|nr:VWA domain-containing protein [Kofleriaceae bacterium]